VALPQNPKSLKNTCFEGGVDRKKIKDDSKRQEQSIARNLNSAKRQPLSGADFRAKGDVKSEQFLIEAKRTDKASLSVRADWLEKITMEALQAGRQPALSIQLTFDNRLVEKDWFLIPASLFYSKFGGDDG